ncbi:cell division protein FtsK [Ferruginivarius sediminum]|uniref:DNA translocase FtsK n=2 Tax=Ferruginivarius sediminum TaxID=2661937 RepID=A0A369TF72_9PROT|nr:cell division protein FtsK [Ferruginivarius sediminum]
MTGRMSTRSSTDEGAARNALDDLRGFARRSVRQAGAALPGLAALALLIALLTYNPSDPSLNVAGGGPISNLLGRPGAVVADLLLSSLGLAGFLPVVLLFGWSWRLIQRRTFTRWWLRLALLPLALLLAATALAAWPTPESWTLRSGLGGFTGLLALRHLSGLSGVGPAVLASGAALLALATSLYVLALSRAEWATLARGIAWLGGGAGGRLAELATRTGEAMRDAGSSDEEEEAPQEDAPPRRRRKRRERKEPALLGGREPAPGSESEAAEDAGPAKSSKRSTKVEPKAPRAAPSKSAQQRNQRRFEFAAEGGYEPPPLSLLKDAATNGKGGVSRDALEKNARLLESVLQDFGVRGEIVKVRPGPVVTRYDLEPAPGTKTSRVVGLADDIARSMSAVSVRVAVVPGSSVIGIELPNSQREIVFLRELLASDTYERSGGRLPLTLGKDISGNASIVDLSKMPHLLVAGTTGSGKSVAINAMLLSLLYRLPPEKCRLILVDPKMLELSVYDGIPHLLSPVVTDPKKAVVALKWTVREMEERYRRMSRLGVRNIDGYNERIEEARQNGEVLTRKVQTGFDPDTGNPIHEEQPFDLETLPYIVVVVDEMADLMLVAGKDIEMAVQRLAQMARAAGIHLIMATQRPSVDVITGTIKANFPTRISFHVTSKIDSRTILGETGAEQLLGQGDMLYMAHGGRITRVHGPLVTDREVEEVVAHLCAQGSPDYVEDVTAEDDDGGGMADVLPGGGGNGNGGGDGDLYQKAVAIVCQHKKASTSFVQRQLQIGYNRAARLIERMEAEGVVSPANHVGKREILIESPHERE